MDYKLKSRNTLIKRKVSLKILDFMISQIIFDFCLKDKFIGRCQVGISVCHLITL